MPKSDGDSLRLRKPDDAKDASSSPKAPQLQPSSDGTFQSRAPAHLVMSLCRSVPHTLCPLALLLRCVALFPSLASVRWGRSPSAVVLTHRPFIC